MTVFDFKEFFDFKTVVRIETTDGDITTGIITGIEKSYDTESGVDEIEVDVGTHYFAIEIPDIVKVEKVA